MNNKRIAKVLTVATIVGNINIAFAENINNANENNVLTTISQQSLTVIKTGITTANLNVRKGPSTSYEVMGALAKGAKVEIVEVSATGWYKIKFKNEYGYVSNKYVEVGKKEESSEEKPTVIKTGITTAGLNVRKGPSTSYGSIGVLSKDTKVEIVEVSATGWYKIKFKNGYGYVSNKYVSDTNTGSGIVKGDRVYQNPSSYFQIQEYISFQGQGNYILKTGTMGLKVRKVQEKLGMSKTNKAIVGPATTAKIKDFQKAKGLPQTGQVDYTTWKALGLSDDDWYNLGSYVSPIQITKNSTKNDCIETMISRAYDYLGTEYIVGASGKPGQGVDCSGLVMQALYATGINPLPVSVIRHSQPGYEYESRNLFTSSKFKKVSY
ncbi:SH3 domain-containing protein [Intestinibacter bartlettii]|uniref:SH3 domain-containing protein n=1 Tax=Intestinibacter bartlettii TaxID=261299 RepID=A0ABS6DZR9_9FIRM|nr:SH3 domain-containing protein [Intestinibacter bartlettii]MBU5337342.1 SH3 domain-containing protein [Intestinibacter bartlettii]